MADWENDTTLDVLQSSHGPGHPDRSTPPFHEVTRAESNISIAIPQKYRKWNGGTLKIEEMTVGEKAIADAAIQTSQDDTEMAELREYVYALKKQVRREINTARTRLDLISSTYRTQAGQSEPTALGDLLGGPFNAGIRDRLEEL